MRSGSTHPRVPGAGSQDSDPFPAGVIARPPRRRIECFPVQEMIFPKLRGAAISSELRLEMRPALR